MAYCNIGDEPTVRYKFNGQTEKVFESQYAPIDVITKTVPIEGSNNYKPDGYGIGYVPLNGNGTYYWFNVVDHKIFNIPAGVNPIWGTTPRIAMMSCGQTTFSKLLNCGTSATDYYVECLSTLLFNGSLDIDPNRKCPTPASRQRCSIQIIYNGLTIFQDQGNCPVTFTVSCGNCPPGTEEHKTNTYPGYCCFDCNSILSEVKGITNTIRGLNRG